MAGRQMRGKKIVNFVWRPGKQGGSYRNVLIMSEKIHITLICRMAMVAPPSKSRLPYIGTLSLVSMAVTQSPET
jgi:hypothetical protein